MPVRHRSIRAKQQWHSGHRIQLSSGHDFFGDAWGDPVRLPMDERHNWPAPEVLDEMAEAWRDLRDGILADAESNNHDTKMIFGVALFDEGMSPYGAYTEIRHRDTEAREARESALRAARGIFEPGR